MPANRGSTSVISAVKETTAGTTPATPTLIELPVTSFTPNTSMSVIASDQIRAHPFRDQIISGRIVHEFGLEFEIQGAVHDMLFETFLGGTITAKALKFLDALKSLTIEEKVAAGDFNVWTYSCFTSMSITAGAGDTTPVKVAMGGMARSGTLDAGATIATGSTPAASVEPFTFAGATATIAATPTPIGSGTLNFERSIDPLMVLGSKLPREFVPGAAGLTGSMTIPYDDSGAGSGATVSAKVLGFTNTAQVWKYASEDGSVFRQITIPKTKLTSLGRPLNDRGMRMQEVNWEAVYDNTSATIATLATE